MRQTTLSQSGAPGCVFGWSDISWQTLILELSLIDVLLIFSHLDVCRFDLVVSLGVESDNQAFV